MKLVVFAYTPPPFHGQSQMVSLMINGLGGDRRNEHLSAQSEEKNIQCFHVNARFADDLATIGAYRPGKIFRLLRYCAESIWCRFRYRAPIFYYIPAPAKRIAFYRDFLILLLCRPFFRFVIFHWHATGLGDWLEREALSIERWLGRRLMSRPNVSLILASALSSDASYFRSQRICVVANGIPDPCPFFETSVLPNRRARLSRRLEIFNANTGNGPLRETYKVLFLAHCTREKGLFDALDAIATANEQLGRQMLPIRIHLTVAGTFVEAAEQSQFESWRSKHADQVTYLGFVGGEDKAKLLSESDCLCFPTFYFAESQPVVLIEAMAFGLVVVSTSWRAIPELLPANYPLLVAGGDTNALAERLLESMKSDLSVQLRQHYCRSFTDRHYVQALTNALKAV